MNWAFSTPQQTIFDKNSELTLHKRLQSLKVEKPLLLVSKRLYNSAKIKKLLQIFEENNITVSFFHELEAEAPIEIPKNIAKAFSKNDCDSIIAIGGGSTIDLAKAGAILVNNEGNIENYFGINTVKNKTVPKIFISTTAGTGSEATNIAVLSDKKNQSKKGIVSKYLFADIVVLDPTYSYSMPNILRLSSGLDALCQCIEGITSKNSSPITDNFGYQGIQLISNNLSLALQNQEGAMDKVYLGAYFSGLVISGGNAGTNLGHAIGNTLGGMFDIPHGMAVSSILEEMIKFNNTHQDFKQRILQLKQKTNIDIFTFIQHIKTEYKIPRLSEIGVDREDIPIIAEKVLKEQQRLLNNNLISVNQEDIITILNKSL